MPAIQLTAWQRWVERPQALWIRRAIFQIHLWTGIAACLYVAAMSISGSAIVYRRELSRTFRRVAAVADTGRPPLRADEIEQRAARAYTTYEVLSVNPPQQPDEPDVVVLESGKKRIARLFDPYTGADLGDPKSAVDRLLSWLADLHDNLLSGFTGRTLNGIGAMVLVWLACTGMILWWPGIKNWRRSLTIHTRARFSRFNWDLHSAMGFWCALLILVWGLSGICLCFPASLNFLLGREFRLWITRLHFGRFNLATEALWTVLGLAPAVLALTGVVMWWNRVLSKQIRRRRREDVSV